MASKGLSLCLCSVPHTEHNSTDFIEWEKYSHTRSKNQTGMFVCTYHVYI